MKKASTSVCSNCGTIKKLGVRSCCAIGGDWHNNCGHNGGPGEPEYDHTWSEGIEACERKSKGRVNEQAQVLKLNSWRCDIFLFADAKPDKGLHPICNSNGHCGKDQFCAAECMTDSCGPPGHVDTGSFEYCQPCSLCSDDIAISGCAVCNSGGAFISRVLWIDLTV